MSDRKDEATFNRRILENPADDLARLVFADWLDEHPTPARQARAELIRLQVARHEGGRTGDVSFGRQLAVAESLRREEEMLKRWGTKWLPRCARGRRAQRFVWRADSIEVLDSDGRTDSYLFERGFVTRVTLDMRRVILSETAGDRVRPILAACPVEAVRISGFEGRADVTLTMTNISEARCWSLFMGEIDRPSGGAFLTFPTRAAAVKASAEFVAEFLPMARPDLRPYTREYYGQAAGPLPESELTYPELPAHVRRQLDERDAEARNNVDMPHER